MMAAAITITIIALCTRTIAKYTVFIQNESILFSFSDEQLVSNEFAFVLTVD